MIKLYNFGAGFDLPDPSPFCLKLDLYLRAAGLEFETESDIDNVRKAPKHKLPYITDGDKVIADSTFIIEYLKGAYGDPLDMDLNPEQQAVARAFIKMLDEDLYWCIVYSRWIDNKVWPVTKKAFFGEMPAPMKFIIPLLARRGVNKSLYAQGLGRHSHNEILDIAGKDLTALSDLLGTKNFFLINKLTTLDVSAYAFIAELTVPDLDSDFTHLARSFDNLVLFVERVRENYYSC